MGKGSDAKEATAAVTGATKALQSAVKGGAKEEILEAIKRLEAKLDALCAVLSAPSVAVEEKDFLDDDDDEIEQEKDGE